MRDCGWRICENNGHSCIRRGRTSCMGDNCPFVENSKALVKEKKMLCPVCNSGLIVGSNNVGVHKHRLVCSKTCGWVSEYYTVEELFLNYCGEVSEHEDAQAIISEMAKLLNSTRSEPCCPTCFSHVSHPCEKCGRIMGLIPQLHAFLTSNEQAKIAVNRQLIVYRALISMAHAYCEPCDEHAHLGRKVLDCEQCKCQPDRLLDYWLNHAKLKTEGIGAQKEVISDEGSR